LGLGDPNLGLIKTFVGVGVVVEKTQSQLNRSVLTGVTKRCRLFWPTYSSLVNEPKGGGRGGVAGSQPMSTAVHRSPNNLWRSNSIFNL
jgi:hypothetical protein